MTRARSLGRQARRKAVSGSGEPAGPAAVPPAPDRAALREAALAHLARFGTTRHGLEQVLLRRVARWRAQAQAAGADGAGEQAQALAAVCAEIAQDMVRLGAVDDAAFAHARARRLVRTGRSSRAIEAHLAARGVAAPIRAQVMLGDEAESPPDEAARGQEYGESGYGRRLSAAERELCAALVLARKRRFGPFASPVQEGRDTEDAVESESAEDWAAGEWDEDAPLEGPAARRAVRGGRRADAGGVHRALGVLARAGFARDTAARALEMTREEADEWLERLKAES